MFKQFISALLVMHALGADMHDHLPDGADLENGAQYHLLHDDADPDPLDNVDLENRYHFNLPAERSRQSRLKRYAKKSLCCAVVSAFAGVVVTGAAIGASSVWLTGKINAPGEPANVPEILANITPNEKQNPVVNRFLHNNNAMCLQGGGGIPLWRTDATISAERKLMHEDSAPKLTVGVSGGTWNQYIELHYAALNRNNLSPAELRAAYKTLLDRSHTDWAFYWAVLKAFFKGELNMQSFIDNMMIDYKDTILPEGFQFTSQSSILTEFFAHWFSRTATEITDVNGDPIPHKRIMVSTTQKIHHGKSIFSVKTFPEKFYIDGYSVDEGFKALLVKMAEENPSSVVSMGSNYLPELAIEAGGALGHRLASMFMEWHDGIPTLDGGYTDFYGVFAATRDLFEQHKDDPTFVPTLEVHMNDPIESLNVYFNDTAEPLKGTYLNIFEGTHLPDAVYGGESEFWEMKEFNVKTVAHEGGIPAGRDVVLKVMRGLPTEECGKVKNFGTKHTDWFKFSSESTDALCFSKAIQDLPNVVELEQFESD